MKCSRLNRPSQHTHPRNHHKKSLGNPSVSGLPRKSRSHGKVEHMQHIIREDGSARDETLADRYFSLSGTFGPWVFLLGVWQSDPQG